MTTDYKATVDFAIRKGWAKTAPSQDAQKLYKKILKEEFMLTHQRIRRGGKEVYIPRETPLPPSS